MDSDYRADARSEVLNEVREPGMYAVIFYNDDVTTMDFVVTLLVKIFHKKPAEASALMMEIHNAGSGVAGVFTFDVAVTKKTQADLLSAEKGFPLRVGVEAAESVL